MNFDVKKIEPKYIGMIDIGTYKIRVGICKVFNRNVELIGYGEKRQDLNDIYLQEIKNIENVCENIKQAVEKAEIDAKMKIKEFMINIPTSNIFFESSSINYIKQEPEKEIDEDSMYKILKDIELNIFKNHYKRIKSSSGYDKNDLKLIISNISNIMLDSQPSKSLLGKKARFIDAYVLNIFITRTKFELKDQLSNILKKEVINIIPTEYALAGLFPEKKDIVILDLGHTHTSVIVKRNGNILGVKKLTFGINDFIKIVRENYNLTRSEIIKKIDENIFEKEKEEFLEILSDILIITLEDILKFDVCPHDFFIAGGGANKFIRDYLQQTDFNKYNLRMVKKINIVTPKIDFIDDKITENPSWIDSAKSNINIYAMIKSTLDFIKKDKNKLERTIKRIIDEVNK
ncbi:hypothetical protein DLH72_02320 [Candidatus Gracilibacteria bacterium]|nr:MAG: hypothetical protein DLH72_02320 [Candidatus Gracilibacteria bacterium]